MMFAVACLMSLHVPLVTAESGDTVVSPAVYSEMQGSPDGTAFVIIMLQPVPMLPKDQQTQQQAAVRAIQDRVLGGLSLGEFTIAHRYANFAGMTGRINASGLAKLASDPDVVAIGVDIPCHAQLDDSVPFIGADAVHALGFTGDGVTVAVLDTGIDTDHPDLSDDIAAGAWHSLDQGVDQGAGAEDDNGHGTNVSGCITSAGNVASVGVAPDTDILAIKVLKSDGSGWVSDWVAGVDYVVSVVGNYGNLCAINMSLGTNTLYTNCPCDNDDAFTQAAQASILAARNVGIVTFASSGNDGSTTSMSSPGCLSATSAVAAVYDQDLGREPDSGTYQDAFGVGFGDCFDAATWGDLITCFSNRSGCNDLAAPGRRITAPGMGGGTSTYTGTSQASPHCAAVAALMCERADDLNQVLTPDDILQIMRDTGHPTDDPAGTVPNPIRVDALAAVQALNAPPVADCQDFETQADGDCCAIVSVSDIDGGSFDPDGPDDIDTICITAVDGDPVPCLESVVVCGDGAHLVTLTITDLAGQSDMCDAPVTIVDDTAPEIACPDDVTVECVGNNGTPRDDPQLEDFFDNIFAQDNCDDDVEITDNAPDDFPMGETVVTFTATDDSGNQSTCTATVTVEDTIPPEITVELNRYVLWPPNHKLVDIIAAVAVTDICCPDPTFVLTDITSNEPDNGLGDGDTENDIQGAEFGTPDLEFQLRAERAGNGDGRIYTIIYTAADCVGNTTDAIVEVLVPHDRRGNALAGKGFNADRNALLSTADEYTIVLPSTSSFDPGRVQIDQAYVGNHIAALAPLSHTFLDINYDEINDLVLTYDSIATLQLQDVSGEVYPVGMHYHEVDGASYYVPDIFNLDMGVTAVPEPADAARILFHPIPNPLSESSRLSYAVEGESGMDVQIAVYDVAGRQVRMLVDAHHDPGIYDVVWDGRDDNGMSVRSGVYFQRVVIGSKVRLIQLTVTR
jgi:hypothetical protein